MNSNDPNVQMLDIVAERLDGELCSRLVFVGGAVAGLLITDPAQPAIRPTEDVDLLAQVIARAECCALATMCIGGARGVAAGFKGV